MNDPLKMVHRSTYEQGDKMGDFNSTKYKNDYNKEHYARLSVLIPIEDKSDIEKYWKKKGYKSFSAYANELIRRDMNNDKDANIHIENINQNG